MNTKNIVFIGIFATVLVMGGVFAVSAFTASAATLTQTFTQHPQATNVFDFGQPMQNPSITVSYVWCWEDGGSTGCFTGSKNISVGQTGLIHSNIKDDGGNGAAGPSCPGYSGNPGAYDYCMSVYSSSWNGQRLTINWIGITDRYLNSDPLFKKPYMTKIDVTAASASVQSTSISAPTGVNASCPNPGTQGTVSWNPVSGAARYAVRVDNLANAWNGYGTPNPGDVWSDTVTNTVYSFSAISGAHYRAWAHAIHSSGSWSNASSVDFTCGTPIVPPPPPPPLPPPPPPAFPTVSMTANPSSIQQGGSSVLSWSSQYAASCSLTSHGAVALSGSKTVMPSQTTVYTIMCFNGAGSASDTRTVTVQQTPSPTVSAVANPTVIQQGGSSVITWSSTNATSCTNNGNSISLSGSSTVSPSQTSSYTIVCSNSVGSGSDTVTVTVNQQLPTISLSASPTTISQGGTSVLSWSSSYASSCFAANGWSGTKPTSGSEFVSPSQTTTYTIVCTNSAGQDTESVTVSVQQQNQPTVSMTANPSSIQQGGSSVLSWSSQYATSCSLSSTGSVALSGSQTVTPSQTTTYTITCSNNAGSQSSSATVSVTQPQQPTVSAVANPTVIQQGGSSVITWSSTNATSCTNNGNPISLSGSSTVSPNQTSSYTIVCSNNAGSESVTVTVTVQQFQQQLPVVSISASPMTLGQPGSSVLSWSSSNANTCYAVNGWSGTKSLSGSETVYVSQTTTYTVTCSNNTGQDTESVTVYVQQQNQPTVTISASPQVVTQGNTAVLSWNSSNAYSCYATGAWSGTKSLSGSETVYLTQTSTYGINCAGTGGSNSSSVTVTVYAVAQTPTASLTGSPTSIGSGGQAVLVWSSSNASYCVGSGGWSGTKSVSGSQTVYPSSTTTYGLTCYNSQGSSTYDSETIGVTSAPLAGIFTAGCAASQSTASVGQSVVFAGGESGGTQPVTYYWAGSINPGYGQTRTVTFTNPGLKTVTLAVTDAQGRVATDTCTVQINSVVVTTAPPPPAVLTTADVCETTCRPQGYIKVTEIPQLVNAGNGSQLTPDEPKEEGTSLMAALFGTEGLSGFGWLLFFLILASVAFLIYMFFAWRKNRGGRGGDDDYYGIPPPPRSQPRPMPTRIPPPAPVPPRVPMPPYTPSGPGMPHTPSGSGAPTPPNIPMRPIHNEDID